MNDNLRVLQVEDSKSDADLILRVLGKGGYEVQSARVEDAGEMCAALGRQWDVIIADNQLPNFNALEALKVMQEAGRDIPFIVVSGTIGEDVAVAIMKAGAHDYILKNNLARLVPAVEREIREANGRRSRQRVEEALRIGEERLAAIIGSAMDAIITVDENQRIVLFNAAAERIFRCPAPEAIGGPLDRFLPERFHKSHGEHIRAYGKTGVCARDMGPIGTLYGRRADGAEFPLQASISQVNTGGQKLFTVILQDITQSKQREELERKYEQATELDRLKTEFFANVSHELRTPLSLILGPVRKRLAKARPGSDERGDLELVERNARLLLRHVNDLLDFSKLDAGQMKVEYSEADLAQVLRLVASNFESLARERGIDFTVETPIILKAEFDVGQIERVILNLVSNAVKFSADAPRVRLTLRAEGDRVILEVDDNGPGIPQSFREAVFERFWQLDSGLQRGFGGTGLGLSIVKQLVELHGGRITVEDPDWGTGTRFRVELPLTAPAGSGEARLRCRVGRPCCSWKTTPK